MRQPMAELSTLGTCRSQLGDGAAHRRTLQEPRRALCEDDAIVVAPAGPEYRREFLRLTTVRQRLYCHRRTTAEGHLPKLSRGPIADPLPVWRKEGIERAFGSGHQRGDRSI